MQKIKDRSILLLKSIIEKSDEPYRDQLAAIDKFFIDANEPKNFDTNDPKSVLVEMDNTFEDVCFLLEHHGVASPKELSIYEFQKRLELIERKLSKKKKNGTETEGQQIPYTR
jgi:hypothetical protein